MRYVFSDCTLDTARRELRRAGVPVPLERKVYQVLAYLVQHGERLIPKDELLAAVWPNVYVTDKAVARCIAAIRKALGDRPATQRLIQTLHGQGYRFVAPVVAHAPSAPALEAAPPAPDVPLATAPALAPAPGASPPCRPRQRRPRRPLGTRWTASASW